MTLLGLGSNVTLIYAILVRLVGIELGECKCIFVPMKRFEPPINAAGRFIGEARSLSPAPHPSLRPIQNLFSAYVGCTGSHFAFWQASHGNLFLPLLLRMTDHAIAAHCHCRKRKCIGGSPLQAVLPSIGG